MELKHKKCIPCEKGGKPLSRGQIEPFMKEVKGWHLDESDPTGFKIEKKLHFTDFKRVIGFVNEVADMADYEGHHPDLFIHDWNKLTITLSTHSMNGLSENDFIIAAKIDQILADEQPQ